MEKSGGKYFLQWESHSRHVSRGLCMLMERQCLVDVAICCGSNTMHAHKCVLAASSTYFKEHFENKAVEQVIVNGVDFAVMKSLIEFMYCGETVVGNEHMKYFIAAAKMFRMAALQHVFAESEYQSITADEVCIPPPQFICKPPKYPTVYRPFNNTALPPKINYALNNAYNQPKFKRKCIGTEAEKACAKEAQASRIALANLRKVMASTPQVHSFIVEESCNETTVENFIPNVEETYTDSLIDVQNLPETLSPSKPLNMIPLALSNSSQGLTADKIKHILGNEEVEIMFQTSDGNFVNVSDEVLLNLSKGGLQYQVVDENGHVGEVQELKGLDPDANKTEGKHADGSGSRSFDAKNHNGIEDLAKTGGDFSDSNFSNDSTITDYMKETSSYNKNGLESFHSTFNEGLYENSFNMQSTEMFEPENLSMHPALMEHNAMEFDNIENKFKFSCDRDEAGKTDESLALSFAKGTVSDSVVLEKLREVEVDENDVKLRDYDGVLALNAETLKISHHDKSSLKFTPDMFFADLPSSDGAEDNAKSNGH